mgnify:CR=1 FL=1
MDNNVNSQWNRNTGNTGNTGNMSFTNAQQNINNQQMYGQQNFSNQSYNPMGNNINQNYTQQPYGSQPYNSNLQPTHPYNQARKSDKQTLSIITLILGITSLLCCCFGWVTGLIGLIIGIIAIIKEPRGKVMAIIGTSLCSLSLIISILCGITGFTEAFTDGFKYGFEKGYNGEEIDYDEMYESLNSKDDHFWGSKYELYGNAIYFYDDGTFTWYMEEEFDVDNMLKGEYKLLFGDDAKEWLVEDHPEYGVTKKELKDYAKRNKDSDLYTEENLTILIMTADIIMEDGEITNDDEIDTYYYGYSNEEGFDSVNLKSFNTAIFKLIY